jgi:hypothetical protein
VIQITVRDMTEKETRAEILKAWKAGDGSQEIALVADAAAQRAMSDWAGLVTLDDGTDSGPSFYDSEVGFIPIMAAIR